MLRNSKKNKHNNKIKQENESIFKSSKYLMSFVLDEYSKEFARGEKLDSKGMALITLLIGFLALSFPSINFRFVVNSFYSENSIIILFGAICAVLLLLSFVFIIYTLVMILKIFKIREYKRFNTDNAKEIELECYPENITADRLIIVYVNDIDYNQKINNNKANLIEKSYKLIITSVVSLLLITILTIIGGTIMENELKIDHERIEKAIEITNKIEKQGIKEPIKMKDDVVLKHSLTIKDSKPIKESMD